ERCRQHNAERGDEERIEEADPESAAECRGARRIGDQRLADIEAGSVVPKPKAGRDAGFGEIIGGIDGGGVDEPADHENERHLQRNIDPLLSAASRRVRPFRHWPAATASASRANEWATRIATRLWSTARRGRARSSMASLDRHCARILRRNCRPL